MASGRTSRPPASRSATTEPRAESASGAPGRDELSIRSARRDDAERVAALLAELDRLHARLRPDFFRLEGAQPHQGTLRRISPELMRRLQPDSSSALLLALRGNDVVGLVHVDLRDTPRAAGFAQRRRLLVDTLVVAPHARRLGIGRALMEAAVRWGKRRGAEQVVLTVWEGNDEAQRFYESLGFSTVSRSLARELE